MTDLRELAQLVDRQLDAPAVVVGSLPHDARDLDLVVPDDDRATVRQRLEASGFVCKGGVLARFVAMRAEVVDLLDAEWLPPAARADLIQAAEPLEGFRQLRRPAPAHDLLIVARRVAGSGEPLSEKRRARIRTALDRDPDAFARAESASPVWGASRELAALRRAYDEGGPVRTGRRLRRPHRRATRLVTLSGVDGSGKTTQIRALADALDALGHPTAVEWARLTYNPSLNVIAAPVKALFTRRRPSVAVSAPAAQQIRQQSRWLDAGWVAVVALVNAFALRRTTRRHRGAVVLRDRYLLDSTVQLFDSYGEQHRLQARLARLIAPRPDAAFFLDVPAAVAHARKQDYDLPDLERHRRRYLELAASFDVQVVDADRAPADVFADLCRAVWDAVSG